MRFYQRCLNSQTVKNANQIIKGRNNKMQNTFKEALLSEMERIIRIIKQSDNEVKNYDHPIIEGNELNIRVEFIKDIDIGELR